jgi:hypothetical protein
MRSWALAATLILGGLSACKQKADPAAPATTEPVPANQVASAAVPKDDRTPLQEPHGPVDPKSPEAAGQVVQSYGALAEQKHWAEANALWGDAVQAAKFEAELSANSEVHLEIGNPGEPEGAAGSIYVTMPVFFYGDTKEGQPFRRSAEITLRRVNDVPGSTEAQRRWHIERIDWTS